MEENKRRAKYIALLEDIKNDIISGKIFPGEKIDSENQLADKYQISRHTVRKSLSILEQEGFVEAIHGVGTFCTNKISKRGSLKTIAFITTYFSDYIFPKTLKGMYKVFEQKGYNIVLKNTDNIRDKEILFLKELLEKNIDGIIIEPSQSQILCKHVELYQRLEEAKIPYIFINGYFERLRDKPHILMNDEQGCYLLTRYLIHLGHTKILGIFKADESQGKERHKGYVRAIREAGIPYNPDLVIWFHTEDRSSKPSIILELMLRKGRPDAIVCHNDSIAMEVYRTLTMKGISVPDDVSLTGYDNTFQRENSLLQLTTIEHPKEKLGEMTAELMMELLLEIPEEESKVKRLIEPDFIEGNSCIRRKIM